MPSGPIRSRAPAVLYRKRMIFRKLSSPMLQDPSTRKTRSALAALQTVTDSEGGGASLYSTSHTSGVKITPRFILRPLFLLLQG